ncbi:MAG: X2-like carbohydrate binding domain-containing protein [Cloacibacillus sp.]
MSPETATFSKAVPADVVLTVTGASLVTSVKNQASVVNASNYSYSSGSLTITDDYLATLANGAKTFTVVTDNGSAAVEITVTD